MLSTKKLRDINFAAKKIAEKLSIAHRAKVKQEIEAYLTFKDPMMNFQTKYHAV